MSNRLELFRALQHAPKLEAEQRERDRIAAERAEKKRRRDDPWVEDFMEEARRELTDFLQRR